MLRELDVLVLDCQATGATPAHGDLLELGWGVCGGRGLASPAHARWILPQSDRGVSRTVRELTGWDDACLDVAVDAAHAWNELAADASLARGGVPTVIHFARFELPFLRQLHAHAGEPASPFPFDPASPARHRAASLPGPAAPEPPRARGPSDASCSSTTTTTVTTTTTSRRRAGGTPCACAVISSAPS